MEEQAIVAARASVMIYDDENKKWIHSGTSTGVSKVHIYQHLTQNTFRVVGRKLHDHELVINCSIIKGLKYNKATPTFHQWRDTKQVYGLNFSTKEDAENFANSMLKVLEILNQAHQAAIQQPMLINGNSVAVMNNNNQLNQNLINQQQQAQQQQQQQQQQQPVYAHLNETQQQIIKQQYQAPPEYSEVISTQANRQTTNGWQAAQNQVQLQNQLVSQPNSLDLNDWRTQQLQHDLNQLNLNANLNGQQQQQAVQLMNAMPIYGHRNSLPNQSTNAQQLQQNAQLIQATHQQLIQTNHQIQITNGVQQTINQQQLNNLTQQIQSPPQQIVNQQQVMISQQSTQPQQLNQQTNLTNSQQTQSTIVNNSNNINNNVSNIPPAPIPPPPPMPPSNLLLNSSSTLNSTTSSINNNKTSTSSLNSNQSQTSGNSLASALANAKLKKTPNKDDGKEKPTLGGGMASMMDEMAKTLARRRAQAESNHLNGSCNGDESESNGRLKNGWDNKNNKSSPNKDNDLHSRTRAGSTDHHIEQFDVEKLKQDIIMEMKKEMNKIKLEIIEAFEVLIKFLSSLQISNQNGINSELLI